MPGNHIKTSLITSISAVVCIAHLSFPKTRNSKSLTNLFSQPLFHLCFPDIPELSDFPGFVAIAISIEREKASQIRRPGHILAEVALGLILFCTSYIPVLV